MEANKNVVVGVVAGVSFLSGGGLSYLLTKRHFRLKYEELMAKDHEETKQYYARMYKRDEYETPESAAKALGVEVSTDRPTAPELEEMQANIDRLGYAPDEKKEPVEEKLEKAAEVVEEAADEVVNIFSQQQTDETFDYEEEKRLRTNDRPYVITHDEFMINENDNQQISLTYFQGDGILVDDKDEVIENENDTVGDANLLRFGHGSKDNNIVYIHNPLLDVDFEIARHTGTYTEQVAGLKHSDPHDTRGKVRRFRSYDE